MKSLNEWRLEETYSPEWESLKFVWGSKAQHVDTNLVNQFKLKVAKIQQDYINGLHNPKIQQLRDLPSDMRDNLAQAMVVAVLKAFYQNLDSTVSGGKTTFNAQKLGSGLKKFPGQQPAPQDELGAPKNWKGN